MKKSLLVLLLGSLLQAEAVKSKENSWGIEFNPFRLLTHEDGWRSYSGGFSYFDYQKGVEIAVPWLYGKDRYEEYYDYAIYDELLINVDIQYRIYPDREIGGFFWGGFARYAYLEGEALDRPSIAKQHKFGLGGIIGYRVVQFYEETPLYLGVSLSLGSYLNQENDIFANNNFAFSMDDRKFFMDIELLKIGIEF